MKYIYYIIGIMIVLSGFTAYELFATRIEISKPFLIINDKIISEAEFQIELKKKPSDMSRELFIESVIDKQLLIQEAIRNEINKEENFRISVKNFFEQSLIKILLDRKFASIVVDVTDKDIEKYENLIKCKIFFTKYVYPTLKDLNEKTVETAQKMESDFINLSDDLKFTLLSLEKGESSKPQKNGIEGIIIYRLDDVQKINTESTGEYNSLDIKKVSVMIQNKKKEKVLEDWTDGFRKSAIIWRGK
ncbi:MAG: hypothetical protein WC836_01975 [Desulfobacula sp.]|jgi:hypothetical protein